MRILVTGAAGFLGSHLCERLVRQDHYVMGIDDYSTGKDENFPEWMLQLDTVTTATDDKGFTLFGHDVTHNFLCGHSPLSKGSFDRVYHLACPASPVAYQDDPIKTWKTSVLGTLNVLDYAVAKDARLLFTSTSEVYGDPLISPQPEQYWGNVNPIGKRSCYDIGKRSAETISMDYQRECGLDLRLARIFNTYGPRMSPDDGRVVSNFIVQGLMGNDMTVYGDGSQTRSFCYVDDMIDGLVCLMESDVFGPVNLGNPNEFTIMELAGLVRRMTDYRSDIMMKPLPSDDPQQRCPDITRAREDLGWEPQIQLEEGISRTMEHFKGIVL